MGWGALISLIDKLLALLVSSFNKREQKEAQHERDVIEKDPAVWFNDHFGGVPIDATEKPEADKTDHNGN